MGFILPGNILIWALIFILIYGCSNGTPDGKLLDLGGYFSGVIFPNIYLHVYTTSIHHEAFLDIYVLGIIVLFAFFWFWCGGLLSILAPGFLGCLTLNVR